MPELPGRAPLRHPAWAIRDSSCSGESVTASESALSATSSFLSSGMKYPRFDRIWDLFWANPIRVKNEKRPLLVLRHITTVLPSGWGSSEKVTVSLLNGPKRMERVNSLFSSTVIIRPRKDGDTAFGRICINAPGERSNWSNENLWTYRSASTTGNIRRTPGNQRL